MSMVLKHREPPGPFEKSCYALLAGSVLLVGVMGYRVLTTATLPGPTPPAESISTPTLGERRAAEPANVLRVVAADPFHPQRTAPASRYVLPETDAVADVSSPGSLRSGEVQLLGTAVSGEGGGFIMCQIGGATPEVVRVGEVIGDLTLRSIARGEAEFTREDGSTVTLAVPSAGVRRGSGGR